MATAAEVLRGPMSKKWYVIHTYSGYEAKVRDALKWAHYLDQALAHRNIVLLIALMYLLPTGVMGGLRRVWARMRARAPG